MRAVLGIDAALTVAQPSGLAIVSEQQTRWQLTAVETSYQRFLALADRSLAAQARPSGPLPEASAPVEAASILCGHHVDLVAVDMPLSRLPITGRRCADNAVSRAYGARKCGTHSPSATRAGPLSAALADGFARAGYSLQTDKLVTPGLIEVYPHPALVELMDFQERVPYKIPEIRKYWPLLARSDGLIELCRHWGEIIACLDREIQGVATALPEPSLKAGGFNAKASEDSLDAIVCA